MCIDRSSDLSALNQWDAPLRDNSHLLVAEFFDKRLERFKDWVEVLGIVLPAADGALIDGLGHVFVRRRADHFFASVLVEFQYPLVPRQAEELQNLAGLAL